MNFGWPGRKLVFHAVALSLPVTIWWVFVYHGANWITGLRSYRIRVHWEAELAIPFVPSFVIIYLSIGLVFVLAPFFLRRRRELNALAYALIVAIALAGVCYLLFPAELAYRNDDPGDFAGLFVVAREIALPYNLLPSLHVAMSLLCLGVYAGHCNIVGKALLTTWGTAIALSTLFTHQHHVLDVVTGFALAFFVKRFLYDRWTHFPDAARIPPANPVDGPVLPA